MSAYTKTVAGIAILGVVVAAALTGCGPFADREGTPVEAASTAATRTPTLEAVAAPADAPVMSWTSSATLSWDAAEGADDYTLTRAATETSEAQFNLPSGATLGPDGTMYVADSKKPPHPRCHP